MAIVWYDNFNKVSPPSGPFFKRTPAMELTVEPPVKGNFRAVQYSWMMMFTWRQRLAILFGRKIPFVVTMDVQAGAEFRFENLLGVSSTVKVFGARDQR